MNTGINPDLLSQILKLAEVYNIDRLVLFGSRARGDFRKISDIDLAIEGGDSNGFTLAVEDETDTLLKYDIIDINKPVNPDLLLSIEKEGVILYEKG